MSSLFPTRADNVGVKPKVLLARTRKQLAFHRKRLSELARPYAEIDNSVEGALTQLLSAFDDFQAHVIQTADWLNNEPGS
jgi:hypothetical protein